jgi:predicted small metal-binding protein
MPDDKALRCDCGYLAAEDDEARLVQEIRRHARDAHGIDFSVEEALLVVLRSQLDLVRESAAVDTRELRVRPNEGGDR